MDDIVHRQVPVTANESNAMTEVDPAVQPIIDRQRNGEMVFCDGFTQDPIRTQDFRHNYWGTDDLDLIGERIHDGHDEPYIFGEPSLKTFVEFDPILHGPVATEKTSVRGFKA
jgi:hypothetical protein